MNRRMFLANGLALGGAAALGTAAQAETQAATRIRIVGISCSPRKGKTTATAVQAALEAAGNVDSRIQIEMIDLGGMNISGWTGGATPDASPELMDDYPIEVEPSLMAPDLGGLIIGSPVYFRSMSALCKAFLERLASLREPKLLLADKPVGVVAVGSYRNGGQELVIEQIQTAMLCHEVMVVGGKPRAHQGATLWNVYNDDITKDEFGMDTARKLGIRVAEAAAELSSNRRKASQSL